MRSVRRDTFRSGAALARVWMSVIAATCGLLLASCGGSGPSASPVNPKLGEGIRAQESGNSALAVSDFLAVVKADPTDNVAWYDLGVIAHQAGQDPQAVKDYRAALAAHPGYFPALYNLAVLESGSDPAGAIALYRRAIAAEPKNGAAHLNLGFLLRSSGDAAAGTEEIAKAVSLDPALASRVPTSTSTVPNRGR